MPSVWRGAFETLNHCERHLEHYRGKGAFGGCQPLQPSEEEMTYSDRARAQDEKVVLKEKEAKQGLELREMRYVLAIGTAGAVIALAIVGYILL
jgi:hypothetical protein